MELQLGFTSYVVNFNAVLFLEWIGRSNGIYTENTNSHRAYLGCSRPNDTYWC